MSNNEFIRCALIMHVHEIPFGMIFRELHIPKEITPEEIARINPQLDEIEVNVEYALYMIRREKLRDLRLLSNPFFVSIFERIFMYLMRNYSDIIDERNIENAFKTFYQDEIYRLN